ncbi:MAG: GAF and ANTAR domain-containing protein [Friedmanniella sp.]|jgi:GAF domain-containing protein
MDHAEHHIDDRRSAQTLDELTAYAALSRIGFADQPLTEALLKVAVLARQALPGSPEVSVTLLERDHARTAAFTGSLAVHLDERQYASGFGPCLDAAVTGQTIKLAMADRDGLYPDFRRIAQRQGITHTLSVGLPVASRTVGALNVYSFTGRTFSRQAERAAATFASYAAIVLANLALYHDTAELAAQLEVAVRSRAVIEQAKGVIIAENHCSGEEAFQLLVHLSQRENVKIRDLAQRLVDRTIRG